MATPADFIEYVTEQITFNGIVRFKKMFGEYMVYVNEKPILLVCDSTVYIKILDDVKFLMENAERGFPYNGAKEHYILDMDDRILVNKVIDILERITPIPKPKKKKTT